MLSACYLWCNRYRPFHPRLNISCRSCLRHARATSSRTCSTQEAQQGHKNKPSLHLEDCKPQKDSSALHSNFTLSAQGARTRWVYSRDTCATVCVDDSDWSVSGARFSVGKSDWLAFPGSFNFLTTELRSINPAMFTKLRWCVLFLCVLILSPGNSLGAKLQKKRCRICKDFVESFERVSLQIFIWYLRNVIRTRL